MGTPYFTRPQRGGGARFGGEGYGNPDRSGMENGFGVGVGGVGGGGYGREPLPSQNYGDQLRSGLRGYRGDYGSGGGGGVDPYGTNSNEFLSSTRRQRSKSSGRIPTSSLSSFAYPREMDRVGQQHQPQPPQPQPNYQGYGSKTPHSVFSSNKYEETTAYPPLNLPINSLYDSPSRFSSPSTTSGLYGNPSIMPTNSYDKYRSPPSPRRSSSSSSSSSPPPSSSNFNFPSPISSPYSKPTSSSPHTSPYRSRISSPPPLSLSPKPVLPPPPRSPSLSIGGRSTPPLSPLSSQPSFQFPLRSDPSDISFESKVQETKALIEKICTTSNQFTRCLTSPQSDNYHTGGASIKTPFVAEPILPMPDLFVEECQQMQYHCLVGIASSIHRIWISIDRQIFLWNYLNRDSLDFFHHVADQVITCAVVAPAKLSVFGGEISHVLVIATTVEVSVYGLEFPGGSFDGELRLFATQLTVPTDDIQIIKMEATSTGRILMAGHDGCLYELDYQPHAGWFSSKCRKINHSSSLLSSLSVVVPSYLKLWSSVDPIVDIAVDQEWNLVCALTQNSSISVYSLGDDGAGMKRIAVKNGGEIMRAAESLCRHAQLPQTIIGVSFLSEGGYINLVATTSGGIRLYFSTSVSRSQVSLLSSSSLSPSLSRPSTLELWHVRLPPREVRQVRLNTQCVCDGAFLFGYAVGEGREREREEEEKGRERREDEGESVVGALWRVPAGEKFEEMSSEFFVGGLVWAIQRESEPEHSELRKMLRGKTELESQHLTPPRTFLCLTSQGLLILRKMRPRDTLQDILRRQEAEMIPKLQSFCEVYRYDEAAASCLALICSGGAPLPGERNGRTTIRRSKQMVDLDIKERAKSAYFLIDDWKRKNFFKEEQQLSMSMEQRAAFSGFCLQAGRVLLPIWSQSPVYRQPGRKMISLRFPLSDLRQMGSFLFKMEEFAREHLFPVGGPPKLDRPEEENIKNLCHLIRKTIETFNLMEMVNEVGAHKLFSSLDFDLSSLTFFDLVTSPHDGISRSLIKGILEENQSRPGNMSNLGRKLSDVCPTFYSESDAIVREEMEKLNVLDPKNPDLQTLRDSLQRFLLIVPQSSSEMGGRQMKRDHDFEEIVQKYSQLSFVTGIVTLGLAFAEAEVADHPSKNFYYSKILASLEILWDENGVVQEKDAELERKIISLLSKAKDPDFHYQLYDWMLKRRLDERLLSMRTAFLEIYLKKISDQERIELQGQKLTHGHFEQAKFGIELLWRYYSTSNQHYLAAQTLFELADLSSPSFGLDLRFHYLSTAKMHAENCVMGGADGDGLAGKLLNELRDRVGVANVQFAIYSELKGMEGAMLSHVGGRRAAEDIPKKLKELDSELKTLQDLYDKYTRPLKLYECQLMVLKCANHGDRGLIEKTWERIFESRPVSSLQNVIVDLGKKFYPSDVIFPLHFLCRNLQKKGVENIVELMTRIGVPYHVLYFGVYESFLKQPHDQIDERVALDLLNQWSDAVRVGRAETRDRQLQLLAEVAQSLELCGPRLRYSREFKALGDQFSELAHSMKLGR